MLIFNGVETASYQRNFEYVGSNFNYRNVDTLVLNGRFAYTAECNGQQTHSAGLTFVHDGVGWVSFSGGQAEPATLIGTDSGYFYTDGGSNVWVDDGGVLDDYLQTRSCTALHIEDIWSDMDYLIDQFSDWQDIVIEGVSLGSGVVKDMTFPSSPDATESKYSITIEIPKEGDINTLAGSGYNGLSLDPFELQQVNSLQESFDVSKNKNGQIEMVRQLSLNVISGATGDSLTVAKSVAQRFITNDDPLLGTINYPSFYSNADKKFVESYNEIRGDYSWRESITRTDDDKSYFWSHGHSFNHGANGVIGVSEEGQIVGLTSDKYASAQVGWNEISPSINARALDFYSVYNTGEEGTLSPTDSSSVRNEVDGTISYKNGFTDDPNEKRCVRWNYTSSVNRGTNNLYTVSEQGDIVGKCGDNYTGRFATASGYFVNTVQPGISMRMGELFSTYKTGECIEDISAQSHEVTYSEFNSSVGYNYSYSNEDTSLDNSDFRARRAISVRDSVPTMGFVMTPYDGEIGQYQKQSEMVEESQTVSLYAKTSGKTQQEFMDRAKKLLREPVEPENVVYKASTDYSFTPEDDAMSLTVVYRYPGNRTRTQSDV